MTTPAMTRRGLIGSGIAALGATALPRTGKAAARGSYALNMTNGNTGEKFRHYLIEDGRWVREALAEFDWFSRDWREDMEYPMDTDSLMIVIKLQRMMESLQPMVLLSGYRTPKTNASLPGAARTSLHMRGLATDITQPGRDLRLLHKAAVSLRAGGVGYYPNNHFVHVDSGRLRHWNG